MRDFRFVWFIAALHCGIREASGEPLTFYFSGEVGFIDDSVDLGDSVFLGAPISGGYTFDPTGVTDSVPGNPHVGNYFFPSGRLWAQIGNYEFVTPNLIMFITNDTLSGDVYEPISVTPFTAAGRQWSTMNIFLWDEAADALNSDALPLGVPDLSDFPTFTALSIYVPGDDLGIACSITSLTPEPTSLALLALGAGLLARRKNR